MFFCLCLCVLAWALAENKRWAGGEARGSRDSDQTAVSGIQNPPATKRGLGLKLTPLKLYIWAEQLSNISERISIKKEKKLES